MTITVVVVLELALVTTKALFDALRRCVKGSLGVVGLSVRLHNHARIEMKLAVGAKARSRLFHSDLA
ncbi:hypothetical protein D3C80_1927490 [compost metagenome]